MERINEQIVKEFYANAYPVKKTSPTKVSWVRGKRIRFDRDALNDYFGQPMEATRDEEELDEYGRWKKHRLFNDDEVASLLCKEGHTYETNSKGKPMRILRPSMKSITQAWSLLFHSNIIPTNHTSDISMGKAYIIWCILRKMKVDIAAIISEEILSLVLLETSETATIQKPLGFPALITGLCEFQGVEVPFHPYTKLRPPMNLKFIQKNCMKDVQGPAPRPRPPQPTLSPMQQHQSLLSHLIHIEQQQAANHRAYTSLNDSFYRFTIHKGGANPFPWPTPEAFAAHVSWPGDSPNFQEGMAPEAPEDHYRPGPPDPDDGDGNVRDDFMEEIMGHD